MKTIHLVVVFLRLHSTFHPELYLGWETGPHEIPSTGEVKF